MPSNPHYKKSRIHPKMKSVKSKLFISYGVIIFLILGFLSIVSIVLLNTNQYNKQIKSLNKTKDEVIKEIKTKDDEEIRYIYKNIDLSNQYLIIYKNNNLLFSNQSKEKTAYLLKDVLSKKRTTPHHNHKNHSISFSNLIQQEGYFQIASHNILVANIEKNRHTYTFFIVSNIAFADDGLNVVYQLVIMLNILIFLILLFLGNLLINKTIKPLKLILQEVKELEKSGDLSKRVKELKTGDEFEELSTTFNSLLKKIENSVENIRQFSSDASHELRTPLTVIQGELDLLRDKKITTDNAKEALHVIDKEQQKLQEIIKNFLLLSRLEKENLEDKISFLDRALFESVESNLPFMEEKKLKLNLQIQDDLKIIFDEKYLQIVINNLLTNAIKYTKNGNISIEAYKDRDKTILHVKDSGIGIDSSDIDKIFERFYRVDKARNGMEKGLGLGLCIVKKICHIYKCKIEVKSQINNGSCFTLKFIST